MGGNKSKKHSFKHHNHHYAAGSNSSSLSSSSSTIATGPQPRTVQERLEQSRREAHRPRSSTEAVQRAGVLTALATAPTKPLETRELLQLPETVPIRQRAALQQRHRDGGGPRGRAAGAEHVAGRGRGAATAAGMARMNLPPAGPPAPRSWGLEGSRFAPRTAAGGAGDAARAWILAEQQQYAFTVGGSGSASAVSKADHSGTTGGFSRISMLQDRKLESHRLPRPRSLKCFALKSLARSWDAMRHDLRSDDFVDLETGTKSALWAYMVHLGVPLGKDDLNILFGDKSSWDLQRLDLTRVVGYSLSVKELSRFLARPKRTSWQVKEGTRSETETVALNETWEDAANDVDLTTIPQAIGGNVFTHLTHLSLARPGAGAHWSDLLEAAPKLHLVTHLSLAYWPTPLLRRDTSVQASEWQGHTSSPLSLNILYGQTQPDWDESAYVLRTLSKATYSLQWLDLEGCNAWLPALAVRAPDRHDEHSRSTRPTTSPSSSSSSSSSDEEALWRAGARTQAKGPDWNGSWSKLKYMHIAQSWFPSNGNLNITRPSTTIRTQVMEYLKDQDQQHDKVVEPLQAELHPLDVERYCLQFVSWEAQELKDREVVKKIREQLRRFVVFDHGWQPVVSLMSTADKGHDKVY